MHDLRGLEVKAESYLRFMHCRLDPGLEDACMLNAMMPHLMVRLAIGPAMLTVHAWTIEPPIQHMAPEPPSNTVRYAALVSWFSFDVVCGYMYTLAHRVA